MRVRPDDLPPPAPDAPRPPLHGLDLEAHLRDPAIKQRLVTPIFDLVAPRYDEFTRRFSFGRDAAWKREVIALAARGAPRGAICLDVACGTGDLALTLAAARPDVTVSGIDASAAMLARAVERAGAVPNVSFSLGDVAALAAADSSIDVVTAGYAVRNAPSWRAAVAEVARVLRPGGILITLDFFRPAHPLWQRLVLGYLSVMGQAYGWLWHREPVAYGYIARSIAHFVSWQAFAEALTAAGFQVRDVRRKAGGAIALHHARKR
jgi:demethylmenaquinone methyltransferase/2-methoxy-6-polyprenyl-1,4-benzoquinol methylase